MTDETTPSRGCARCGACCQDIPCAVTPERDYDLTPDDRFSKDLRFIREHWTRTGETAEGTPTWSCDRFDATHGLCTAQDDKPPVCSLFPWYPERSRPEIADRLPLQCSYLGDLPPDQRPDGARPLIPIEVIHR